MSSSVATSVEHTQVTRCQNEVNKVRKAMKQMRAIQAMVKAMRAMVKDMQAIEKIFWDDPGELRDDSGTIFSKK